MKCQIIDKNNNVIDTIGINIYKSTLLKEEKAEKIGEGMDTNVFKKNNIVYKIIKPNGNIHLSLLTAKYLFLLILTIPPNSYHINILSYYILFVNIL